MINEFDSRKRQLLANMRTLYSEIVMRKAFGVDVANLPVFLREELQHFISIIKLEENELDKIEPYQYTPRQPWEMD